MLNQFHDVLPGSSINLVYVDATKFYEDITLTGLKLRGEALSFLVDSKSIRGNISLFNPTGWTRSNIIVEIPSEKAEISKFEQSSHDGKFGLVFGELFYEFTYMI